MKKILAWALLLTALMALFCGSAASAESDWAALYQAHLVELQKSAASNVQRRIAALLDLTKDGVPEMAVLTQQTGGVCKLSLLTVSGGSVTTLTADGFDAGHTLGGISNASFTWRIQKDKSPVLQVFLSGSSSSGDAVQAIWAFTGKNDALQSLFWGEKRRVDGTIECAIGGENVSEAAFSNARRAYLNQTAAKRALPTLTFSRTETLARLKTRFAALAKKAAGYTPGADAPSDQAFALSETALNLYVNATVTLKYRPVSLTVRYESSDDAVATVSSSGVVKAKNAGQCVIRATASNGETASCKVTVKKASGVIVDISQHENSANIDWAKVAQNVDLLILRCGVTRTYTAPIGIGKDQAFEGFAKKCQEYKIPFGVYYYGKVSTAQQAEQEAEMAYRIASPYKPLFYVYDAEEKCLSKSVIETFVKTMRGLGAKKVGLYLAHHLYKTYQVDTSLADFIWIPRYDGKSPAYPCDLHQFTSTGRVPGLPGNQDINRLMGTKSLAWFLES